MNKKFIKFLIIILLSSHHAAFAQSQIELPPKLKNFIKQLDEQKNTLQGGAIAILYKGEVVYKTTFRNQKGDTGAITDKTLFPLASISKAVSATAIALMVDQGTLNLDKTFTLPDLKDTISLINILSHTTGYQFSENYQIEQGATRPELLVRLQKQQPSCKPGECYRYNNLTFSLLEEALNYKGPSLKGAIDNLGTALKTQEIQILPLESDIQIAYPHSKKTIDGVEVIMPLPLPPYYPKAVPAAAGIFASIDGMIEIFKLSFGYKPDLISKKTLDCIYTAANPNKDIFKWQLDWFVDPKMIESYYALGWRILKIKNHANIVKSVEFAYKERGAKPIDNRRATSDDVGKFKSIDYKDLIFHSGYIEGINSFIGFIPSEELGIIILINQNSKFPLKNGLELWFDYIN